MFDTLISLSEQFEGAVKLDVSKCLNFHIKVTVCPACVEACPVEALTFTGDVNAPIALNEDLCTRCGACVSACPTGALTQPRLDEEQSNVTKALRDLQGAAVELTCPQHPGEDESRAPVEAVVDVGRCLSSLTVSRLLSWVKLLEKDIWLNDDLCSECPIGEASKHISVLADYTNRFLKTWGRKKRIHLTSELDENSAPKKADFYDGQQPAISRRDFFSSLGRIALKSASVLIEESLPVPLSGSDKEVPEERMRLRAVLDSLGEPVNEKMDVSYMPFANVVVSELCSGCDICTKICPTDALTYKLDESGEYFLLNFLDADCVGCNRCAVVCPEQAIQLEKIVESRRLIDPEPRPVMTGKLVPCSICGRPTRKRPFDEEPVCYVCRAHRKNKVDWKEEIRKLNKM